MSGLALPQRRSFANGNLIPGTTERLIDQPRGWSSFGDGVSWDQVETSDAPRSDGASLYAQAVRWPPVAKPVPVALGRLGAKAGPRQRLIAEHIRLILGVRLALGVPPGLALPYAHKLPSLLGLEIAPGNVGRTLKALCERGVIVPAGHLRPRPGRPDGTRKYRPPDGADDFGDEEIREALRTQLDQVAQRRWEGL